MAIRREPQVRNTNVEISNCDIVHACGVAACATRYRQVHASDSKDSEFTSKPPKKKKPNTKKLQVAAEPLPRLFRGPAREQI